MKAVRYKIEVTTDQVHGWKKVIEEIFIPEVNIIINNAGGLFFNGEARNDVDLIEIDIIDEQVNILEKHLETKKITEEVRRKLFIDL